MTVLLRGGRAVLSALLLASVAACASGPGANVMRTGSGSFEGEVRVTVENNDFRDATIYALWNGVRQRVGMVTGKTEKTLQMDWRSEVVRFEVDFVGGGGFRSDRIDVYQGDHLNFVILPRS